MKKLFIGAAIIASVAIGFVVAFALVPAKHASAPAKLVSDITTVNLTDKGAVPDEVNVIVGKTVQFNSKDGKSHNLGVEPTHSHGSIPDTEYTSGTFGPNEAWKVTFKEAGSFNFTDQLNPGISILVIAYHPSTPGTK